MKAIYLLAITASCAFHSIAQHSIPVYSARKLMNRASSKDTVYVIAFWASWCNPCVKELPVFDTIENYYKNKPVKVLMVSYDFKESYPDKLTAFIKKKHVQPEVVWFNETNANNFIPIIDSTWSGALPATLILLPGKHKKVFEDDVTCREVMSVVDSLLKR